ncbi:MAG: type I 3-dehydroquinate dehydratase [Chloroflexota bacterium]|nr:type I 3-dehydroquinate dehydratase [Chloroflexota bacterium]
MTFLAVAIAAPDTASARLAMAQAAGTADLAELRLDLMQRFDLAGLLRDSPLPVIVTCRPPREGGNWRGTEGERLAVLQEAACLGPAYIDLEWDSLQTVASLDRSRTRLILSRHDFDAMPAGLAATAAQMRAAGADVVKVVGNARKLADVAPVLELLASAAAPTIAIAMGQYGLLSRIVAFRYSNALLSFAAPDPIAMPDGHTSLSATAPGQITAGDMLDIYRVEQITCHTALIGLMGQAANGSPRLITGNDWLDRRGMDAVLIPMQLGPNETPKDAWSAIRGVLPLAGCLLESTMEEGGLQMARLAQEPFEPAGDLREALSVLADR